MKPRIGRKVYCVYEYAILAEPVYAVGKDSFLLNPLDKEEDCIEWNYEDYNTTWFTSLKEAKRKLLKNFGYDKNDNVKIVKCDYDYYEIQGVDE